MFYLGFILVVCFYLFLKGKTETAQSLLFFVVLYILSYGVMSL